MKALRVREVADLVGLSRTTIWRLERIGLFPTRVQLSTNSVGWLEPEVRDWLAKRPRGRSFAPIARARRTQSFR